MSKAADDWWPILVHHGPMTPTLPTYSEMRWPTISALRALGGKGTISEIFESIVASENYTVEQLAVPHKRGKSRLQYQVDWCRSRLKELGLADNPSRGLWQLTPLGLRITKAEMLALRAPRESSASTRRLREGEQAMFDVPVTESQSTKPRGLSEVISDAQSVLQAFRARKDLHDEFKHNALLIYALELRFAIDDIIEVGRECLTDGPGDKKCDALYVDRVARRAVIAQAYQSQTPKASAKANKASDLNTAVSWIFDRRSQAVLTELLQSQIDDLRGAIEADEVDTVELWYCHNSPRNDAVQEELNQAARSAKIHLRAEFTDKQVNVRSVQVGLELLTQWYETINRPILVTEAVSIDLDGWFEERGSGWTSVCTSVPASVLVAWHKTYGEKLFSANLRGFLSSKKTRNNINHQIVETVLGEPTNFWAFNNGVTILVNRYEFDQANLTTLRLEGLAVVNGAQTTGALSEARASANARVLTRFVRCEDRSVLDSIIRYNNTQNPIRSADFRSTDINQQRLRDEMKSIPNSEYSGARRGGDADRMRRAYLSPTDSVAQALASFHGAPGTAYHNLRGIWEDESLYLKYFGQTSAKHVVYTYSLLSAIQRHKGQLAARAREHGEEYLGPRDRSLLSYFRRRGSSFLVVAAIGNCQDVILEDPRIPDLYRLSFGTQTSLEAARSNWAPIVAAAMPFVNRLGPAAQSGGLHNADLIARVLKEFHEFFESTGEVNRPVLSQFGNLVETT